MFKLLQANTKALNNLVESSDRVAKATTKSAAEAKQRNGHLGEQSLKLAELITKQNKDVARISEATIKTAETLSKSALIAAEDRDVLVGLSGPQVVHEQTVEHQVVGTMETKDE